MPRSNRGPLAKPQNGIWRGLLFAAPCAESSSSMSRRMNEMTMLRPYRPFAKRRTRRRLVVAIEEIVVSRRLIAFVAGRRFRRVRR
jgi:hypothetical protein